MHKHSDLRKSKRIPTEESDSEEDVKISKKSTKTKVYTSDTDDMTMADTDIVKPSKQNRGDIQTIIKNRISQFRDEQKGKDFQVPEGIKPERMRSRYQWLWDQIGDTGIPCKPTKKVLFTLG